MLLKLSGAKHFSLKYEKVKSDHAVKMTPPNEYERARVYESHLQACIKESWGWIQGEKKTFKRLKKVFFLATYSCA